MPSDRFLWVQYAQWSRLKDIFKHLGYVSIRMHVNRWRVIFVPKKKNEKNKTKKCLHIKLLLQQFL